MQLFYNKLIAETSTLFVFDKDESKHIIKVLRKKESDTLMVTDGYGCLFETIISKASDTKCEIKIISVQKKQKPDYKLHLAVAPTKMNDRYEWLLEKCTEIGIQEITPILCDNSERKSINIERFNKIIESAMKQSLHLFLPVLNEPISYKEFIKKEREGQKFIAHCSDLEKKSLKSELIKNKDCTILIGPEGDFSIKEIELALTNNYKPITLGTSRLRTETAAIVACHSVSFINE